MPTTRWVVLCTDEPENLHGLEALGGLVECGAAFEEVFYIPRAATLDHSNGPAAHERKWSALYDDGVQIGDQIIHIGLTPSQPVQLVRTAAYYVKQIT